MSDTARDSGGRDLPDVVVLAGGLGTRLRSVVVDRPKVLAPVRGRPFLAYLLDWLSAAGAGRVILAVGYLADAIRDAVGVRHGALDIHYAVERSNHLLQPERLPTRRSQWRPTRCSS